MTSLPIDINSHPIPAMRLKNNGAHAITASIVSARNITPFSPETKVISLYATAPVYVRVGGSDVTAQAIDHYFPEGIYYDLAIGTHGTASATHIAVLRAGDENATVYVSEKE